MKNKLILLVSMLLPLISGCGEKPTLVPTLEPTIEPTLEPTVEPTVEPTEELIPEVDYDEFITHKYDDILNDVWFPDEAEFLPSVWEEIGIKVLEEYNVAILSFENAILKNTYLCGYVDSAVVEELETTNFIAPDFMYDQFMGVNDLYAKYCQLLNKEEKFLSPIVWYEFNENFDIPDVIDNKKIIMKSHIYEVPINSLNGDYISSFDYVLEGIPNERLNMLDYSKTGKWPSQLSYMNYRFYSLRGYYIPTTKIDGVEYVSVGSHNNIQLFGKNIFEEVDYVQKKGVYYFNLVSLAKFIKENKK